MQKPISGPADRWRMDARCRRRSNLEKKVHHIYVYASLKHKRSLETKMWIQFEPNQLESIDGSMGRRQTPAGLAREFGADRPCNVLKPMTIVQQLDTQWNDVENHPKMDKKGVSKNGSWTQERFFTQDPSHHWEAELYAMGMAIQDALHLKSLLQEMKLPQLATKPFELTVYTDSSSGKALASKLGLTRKSRHVQLRYLYMQDLVASGQLKLSKIPTDGNPADVLTKYLGASTRHKLLPTL